MFIFTKFDLSLKILLISILFAQSGQNFSMETTIKIDTSKQPPLPNQEIEKIIRAVETFNLENNYDSDSEDEEDYLYPGETPLNIERTHKQTALALYRGIHLSPSFFDKKQRSYLRRTPEIGKPVFSSAAYDLAGVKLLDENNQETRKKLEGKALLVKGYVSGLIKENRDAFHQLYTNQYEQFNKSLTLQLGFFSTFLSSKNPLISTSESFRHACKYGFGKKFIRSDIKNLYPEYDMQGKPKHPYLGKVCVILVNCSDIQDFDPYFVVCEHANGNVSIFNHFANDILSEQEVSIPGLIPGKYIVYEKMLRVPSFAKTHYPKYFLQKYGITEHSFKILRTKLQKQEEAKFEGKRKTTIEGLIEKVIQHTTTTIEEHVKRECTQHNITLMFKSLDEGFREQMPSISEAKNKRAQ